MSFLCNLRIINDVLCYCRLGTYKINKQFVHVETPTDVGGRQLGKLQISRFTISQLPLKTVLLLSHSASRGYGASAVASCNSFNYLYNFMSSVKYKAMKNNNNKFIRFLYMFF